MNCDCCCIPCQGQPQRHVHEILGSTRIAEAQTDPHNHRFAAITGEAIPSGNSHVHRLDTRTDFYEDHFHFICAAVSGPAINVSEERHVHLFEANTNVEDGHFHELLAGTQIDNPIGDPI